MNTAAFDALGRWARRFPDSNPEHYVFPLCEYRRVDFSKATKGWRTAWTHALRLAGARCRFHDLRVMAITKMAEGGVPDLVVMAIAGHVFRKILEHYSRIRTDAKQGALEALKPVFQESVNQNMCQIPSSETDAASK